MAKVADLFEAEGVSYKRQREIYSEAGYDISEPTFRRLRARVHEGLPPLSADKSSGRPKALMDRQILVFIGWVLHQNDEDEIAGIRECRSFIEDTFGFEVAQGTVHKYLMQNGFSSHKGRRRTAGYKFDLEALIDLYEKDLERLWALGIKDMRPQDLACMDSSSLGWRLLTRKTYSPKGGTHSRKFAREIQRIRTLWCGPHFRTESIGAQRYYSRATRNLLIGPVCEIGLIICSRSTKLIQAESWP